VLADQYGVGLSTLRESLQVLETVGLVASHPGKGTWVRQDALEKVFNPSEVKTRLGQLKAMQVYEARSIIEVGLTRFAAQRATPEEILCIWEALRRMEVSSTDIDQFVQADLEFHTAVAKAGHNQLLEQFYYLVRDLLSEVITELVELPDVIEESIRLQRAIIQAIEKKDAPLAEKAARRHMEYIEQLVTTYS
jgi:GntR family transcriptional regulator, transcriptional repressor for pyruvate dehydrogenase complex